MKFTPIYLFVFALLAPTFRSEALCVQKSGAILRAQPESSAAQSWKVPKHMPLQATGTKKGSWLEVVDLDGQKHWANKRDVSETDSCIVVRVKKSRLRTGPGNQFEVAPAGVADKYTSFQDLGGEDGWTQVEDEMGQRAWINLDQTWKARRKMRMSFEEE